MSPVSGTGSVALEQVADNLLSNAITFAAGNPVGIRLVAGAGEAGLSVTDRGIGIAEADRTTIFGRFERAVGQREPGGFGVGLWLANRLVVAMGGTIVVESAPGERTRFTVTLPGAATRELAHRDAPRPPEQIAYLSAFGTLMEEGPTGLVTLLQREIAARRVGLLVLDGLVAAGERAASGTEFKVFVQELQTQAGPHGCTVFLLTMGDGKVVPPRAHHDGRRCRVDRQPLRCADRARVAGPQAARQRFPHREACFRDLGARDRRVRAYRGRLRGCRPHGGGAGEPALHWGRGAGPDAVRWPCRGSGHRAAWPLGHRQDYARAALPRRFERP